MLQVNGGRLPPHVGPFCIGGAILGAALPILAAFLEWLADHLASRGAGDAAAAVQPPALRTVRHFSLYQQCAQTPDLVIVGQHRRMCQRGLSQSETKSWSKTCMLLAGATFEERRPERDRLCCRDLCPGGELCLKIPN